VPYLSASAVVIHYEEALYQVYAPYLYSEGYYTDLIYCEQNVSFYLFFRLLSKTASKALQVQATPCVRQLTNTGNKILQLKAQMCSADIIIMILHAR